ncbi:MAG TPA: Zn-dependent hydrolase [Gaiellaceae bacterium]|nr:Zn-dependent hydrolase [Gaiellaceae bacterium]
MSAIPIDRARSAERIERDIEALAGPEYTSSTAAIRRYAYIDVYRNTLAYFTRALEELGFTVEYDPVGTLVARNHPPGAQAFGVGSHCDSNRDGGKYDGTLGVVTALEVCRLNGELGLDLPLRLISFLEEEGSGFGQVLLGSRIVAQRVSEEDLRERFRAIDDGRPFWTHAEDAGYEPARWRNAVQILDGLTGWIEAHIEQARVLQDTGNRIGVVSAIAGISHGDVVVEGRADHAGGTPMDMRLDAAVVAAEFVLEARRLARDAGAGTVATVGEVEIEPGVINVIPRRARASLDVRSVDQSTLERLPRELAEFARARATDSGMAAEYRERQVMAATPMDERVVGALDEAARAAGEPHLVMASGGAHDTMVIADRVPSAMVFVPCKDGISHSPEESADPADAALAAEVMLNALVSLR